MTLAINHSKTYLWNVLSTAPMHGYSAMYPTWCSQKYLTTLNTNAWVIYQYLCVHINLKLFLPLYVNTFCCQNLIMFTILVFLQTKWVISLCSVQNINTEWSPRYNPLSYRVFFNQRKPLNLPSTDKSMLQYTAPALLLAVHVYSPESSIEHLVISSMCMSPCL